MESIIFNPKLHDVLAIVKGFRNGAVYGSKIRFPHALVMTFLFRDGSVQDKIKFVLKATFQHARNLAYFVTLYKSLMLLQKTVQQKERSYHSFVAGLVGGYVVFGKNNNINNQIVLYLFSRIMIGLAKTASKKGLLEPFGLTHQQAQTDPNIFSFFAAVTWGVVMWLFRHERDSLQPSLQASMQYLYNDSEKWDSFRNFLVYNK